MGEPLKRSHRLELEIDEEKTLKAMAIGHFEPKSPKCKGQQPEGCLLINHLH